MTRLRRCLVVLEALKEKKTNRRLDRAIPEALVLNLHDMLITRTAAVLNLSQGPEADDYDQHHRPGLGVCVW
jgi:hypothetical protein